jgi:hypothetical protein
MVAYAAQLSCYANASHTWDGANAEPLPEVDTAVAYLLWLPFGSDRCELIEVDVAKGAHWVDVALEVDAAHKDKAVARKIEAGKAAPSFHDPISEGITRCLSRIGALIVAGVEADHIRSMWPDGCQPLGAGPAAHTAESIDAIEATLLLLEMEAGLARAVDTQVDAMIERLKRLPSDLLAAVTANGKAADPPVPNLTTGRATANDLERLEVWVSAAEREHGERLMQLTNALSPLRADEATAIVEWATEQREEPTSVLAVLTDLEAERALALAELYEQRDLDRTDLLVEACGSKADVLAAARTVAATHGLAAPKSTADVAGDRVLAALVLHTQKAAQ